MKILVTGGAGYIGSQVVRELLDFGHSNIIVVDDLSTGYIENIPEEVEFVKANISDKAKLDEIFKQEIETVFHFAASKVAPESVTDPLKYYDNNVSNSINLLKISVENKVKNFIFSSSAAVYGDVNTSPITEEFETKPTNPYGWSKLIFEKILADASIAHQISYVSLRYFNAGGADPVGRTGNNHEKGEDVISALMRVAKDGKDFTIFGNDYQTKDGTAVRDLIHVKDLATAHIAALNYLRKRGASIIVNIGSEQGFTVKEITERTKEITKSGFKVLFGERRAGDVEISVASSKKAKTVLGWEPKYSLEDIIKTAWDWEMKTADRLSKSVN